VSIGHPLYPSDKDYDEIVKSLYEEVVTLLKAKQRDEH